ncbi:MAG: restriction endonuclease subunit S [Leptospirales bacterium]
MKMDARSLPKGWASKKLGDVASKIGSGATPRGGNASYKTEGISLVRSMNVHDFEFRERNLAFIDDQQAKALDNVALQENDVLLNITGASVARCCIIPTDYLPARVNQHVSIIRTNKELVDPTFLNLLLTSKFYKDKLLFTGEQGATRQAITKAQLEVFIIAYPKSLPEQKRIVSILDKAFAVIAKAKSNAEQNLKNAKELFESYLQSVFENKGNEWEEKTLGEVCEISSKLIDPRKPEFQNLIHIGAGNIESQKGTLLELKTAKEENLISGKFLFDESMVLYSKIRPYLMKVVNCDFQGLCSADIYPLSPSKKKMTKDFLYHMLLSKDFTEYAILGSERAGMPKVNRNHLFAYKLYLPTLKTQQTIVAKLDALSVETKKLETIYQQKLNDLDELKKSILQKAFSGELNTTKEVTV